MFRQEPREQEDREKKRAEKDKPFGLLARMKASGWDPGKELPVVDGVEVDHTIESFALPLGKPVEWAGRLIRASWLGRALTTETIRKGSSLLKSGIAISEHAALRMTERGVTPKMVEIALSKGAKYFDPKNDTFNYILKSGFGSGKDLLIGTNIVTGRVTTVLRGNNLIKQRFIPQ